MLRPFSSETYRRNTKSGEPNDACCLCGKPTAGQDGAIHVPVNHCTGEFVMDSEIAAMGAQADNDVSLYPIGPECAKRWAKGYPETTRNRFRRSHGKLIPYDHRVT